MKRGTSRRCFEFSSRARKKVTSRKCFEFSSRARKKVKRGEFNFAVIFAMIAGAAILILAIYGAFRAADTSKYQSNTEIAKQISILTDPLQAGFAEGKKGAIIFNTNTRIENECFDREFGKNEISVSMQTNIGDGDNRTGVPHAIYNKYIFSPNTQLGRKFIVFSRQFNYPYKVADLTFLISEDKDYCFQDVPPELENEILNMNLEVISIANCSSDSINVCFEGGSNCDIYVHGTCTQRCENKYDEGYVEKNGERFYFVDSLIYGAIFSSQKIYECNVKRLMYRTAKIAEVFSDKTDLMNARGCNTNMKGDLILMGGTLINSSATDIVSINQLAKEIEAKNENDRKGCGVW